jgi:thymidylate synthase ThyX
MRKSRRIYLLDPKELSPETIAVTFAKTSRSPKPFDEIASELTDARSAQFHEKWVIGYGHASVAEHAVLHFALENISRLAIETIEGNRLASYTEKSTRYQLWDPDAFYIPDELDRNPLAEQYSACCQHLFQTYLEILPKVEKWCKGVNPQEAGESSKVYDRRAHTAAVDICRFLLPSASLANVGVTINARALEYAICKMLSSRLMEVQGIGNTLREVGQSEVPTLIKYAKCNPYLISTREKMREKSQEITASSEAVNFKLISWDENGQDKVIAAILFRFSDQVDFRTCLNAVANMDKSEKSKSIQGFMEPRGKFDQPLREFEYAHMTFEAVMDQGAYFEFKRHRMMTQTVQSLTANLGFAMPRGITESGCEVQYSEAMHHAQDLYHRLAAWNPDVASYVVPNGFNRRILFGMNLREAFHFCRLRAAENAHFSIRRVAQQVVENIREIYPLLGVYLDVPETETSQGVKEGYFTNLRAN